MIVNYFFVMVEFTVHFCHEQLSNILLVFTGFVRLLVWYTFWNNPDARRFQRHKQGKGINILLYNNVVIPTCADKMR